ncbi:MAG TPA: T9SS type A sorting domain-containing protein, partial [Panacibacter sp.]|nr:T9SS type A sorting domain-containing protein [Panacibacter sp.]
YHVWDGAAWTGTGVNVNSSGTEAKGTFDGSKNGFIEVRVPYSTIGNISSLDAQFIITGNNGGTDNGHGCFDAVPNDNNCTSWNAPGNASIVSNYAGEVLLPLALTNFTGILKNGTVNLSWKTAAEINLKNFEIEKSSNGSSWTNEGTVAAKNSAAGANYTFSIGNVKEKFLLLRLKMIDRDGQVSYSRVVTIKVNGSNIISLVGNPATNVIKVAVNQEETETFQAVLYSLEGKKLAVVNYQHAGGSGVMELSTNGIAPGLYLLQISSRGTNAAMKVVIQ